ncbi:MAG TPA: hypothetical protein VL624_16500 [Caldimonas sp.]|jgi:hypothetical protein|nr:hypothetical protein [Caldimonas sp.]
MVDFTRLPLNAALLTSNLRILDPKLFKPDPLPAGKASGEVTLSAEALPNLVRTAALAVSGFDDDAANADRAPTLLWRCGSSDLLVLPGGVQTRLAQGVIAISIPVQCDQTGATFVHVSFFVGEPSRPAGLVAATEPRPRGPAAVVDVWGERLVAFGWQIVVALVTQIAADSGRDEDGAPLLPTAMSATPQGLTVLPIARHAMDRGK